MAGYRMPGAQGLGNVAALVVDPGTSARTAMPAPGTAPTVAVSDDDAPGLTIALTPLQLAAVLEAETVDARSSISTRLWGVATALGGALELTAAGALLFAPEPTTLTKVAGGVLGVHGADTASTGLQQIATGQEQSTLTSQGTAALAEALGATPSQARTAGTVVDIAVPLIAGFAAAARVLAIRRGTLVLAEEEAAGGHTIARHVGRTERQLAERLALEPDRQAVSTFRTLGQAERAVGDALRANREAIATWAKSAADKAPKVLSHTSERTVGDVLVRATGRLETTTTLRVVLRRVSQGDRLYFVLTAYPVL